MQHALTTSTRRMMFGAVTAILFAVFSASGAHAATVTFVSGQVTIPGGTPASGVLVELHNGNGSVSYNATTDGSGNYSITGDDSAANGQQLTVEIGPSATLPAGHIRPTNGSSFTYTNGMGTQTANFELVAAAKSITVNVVYADPADGTVANADVQAIPVNATGATPSSSGTISNGTGTLQVSGGKWVVKVDRNLSEQDPTRYPWIAIGGAQEVEFANDSTVENTTLTFTVVKSTTLITVKPVDKDSASLTKNSFNGDVSFVGYTEYGAVSTQAKVNGTTGVATLYLLPGIYTVDAYHPQLSGQSFDPADNSFVLSTNPGATDWGTLKAKANSGVIKGKLTIVDFDSKDKETTDKKAKNNITIKATNIQSGRTHTTKTDKNGSFTISNVGAGEYAVDVDQTDIIPIQGAATTIKSGGKEDDLEIVATRKDITLQGTIKLNGAAATDFPGTVIAQSGDDEFSAPVEPDGSYSMKLYRNGDKSLTVKLVTQKGAEFYADSTSATVGSGSTITKDISVSSNEATISGTIVDYANSNGLTSTQFGDNMTVTAIHTGNGSVEEATVNDDGTYSLAVGPGEWKIVPKVTDPDADVITSGVSNTKVTVSAGENKPAVNPSVHVNDGGSVAGVVKDKDGNALAQAHIVLTNQPELDKASGDINPNKLISTTVSTDASGAFTTELPDGKYTAFFSEHPELNKQVAPKRKEFTVAGGAVNLGEMKFAKADNAIKGTIDNKLDQASITFYSTDGKSIEGSVNVKTNQYSADINDGKWVAVVSGVNEAGQLAMQTRQVEVSKGRTYNFPNVPGTGVDFPAAVRKSCSADEVCSLSNTAGAQLRLSPFAADTDGTIAVQIAPVADVQYANGNAQVGIAYEMNVWNGDGAEVSQLSRPADITLPIEKALLDDGVSTKELTPSFLQPELGQLLSDGLVSTNNASTMTIQTDHLTRFAVTTATKNVKPGKPTNLKAAKASSSTATLEWKYPLGSTVKYYNIEVRKAGKSNTVTRHKKIEAHTYTKKSLAGNTNYEFRAQACNLKGCGKYTSWKGFKTK